MRKLNNIDKIRAKKNMSYGDIGEKAGITAQYVSMLAKGDRENPSLEVMKAIADALGVKVNKVFDI